MTWYDAVEFCNKRSALEGLESACTITSRIPATGYPISSATVTSDTTKSGYRLPTEMEWVWAAMGATSDVRSDDLESGHNAGGWTKGYAGSTEAGSAYVNLGDYAWYDLNCVDPENKTHPVGTKAGNELGFFDMSGNVCEWMWDPYSSMLPTGLVYSDSSAGRGLSAVSFRVKKG